MTTTVGYATHGETLKLLYDAFGVLPRKEAGSDGLDEKDKKTLQKQLTRLASEDGNLVENYEKAIAAFGALLPKYLTEDRHSEASSLMFRKMDQIYAEMIRTEGTYLNKSESLRYFISIKAVPTFVMALNRNMLIFGIDENKSICVGDVFWYLPTLESDGRLVMPLEKVLRWAYAVCEVSQKQFHCPGRISDPIEPAKQQNLDNAVNWTRGRTLPSLPALIANFKESFSALAEHGCSVKPEVQTSIFTALVYARVATFIAKQIQDAYGEAYLDNVCQQVRQMTHFLKEEVEEFKDQIAPMIAQQTSYERAFLLWMEACAHHEYFVGDKVMKVRETLLGLHAERPFQPFRPVVLDTLVSKFGNFAVHANTERFIQQTNFLPPVGFPEMLSIGFDLKNQSETTLEQINEFEVCLANNNLQETLCWLPPWLRGVYHYRLKDFAAAFPHYEDAFERAKYRAGENQYKLVNQFVELAAKNDKAVPFKKGVDWAAYIGLKIRWLRDKEPTQENLDFARYMMKRADYAHQL